MIKNYFKTAFRTLIKNKAYTFINVIGLSLGILCSLAIFMIFRFETSFDTYHNDRENIYRVVRSSNQFGIMRYDPGVPEPLPAAMRNDFQEIEYLTIVNCNFGTPILSTVKRDGSVVRFKEEEVTFANPDYFKIFKYEWVMGNPEIALGNPNSVVISESIARKYFGEENPLGQTLTYDNQFEMQVTGLVKDVPNNTDMPFNIIITYDQSSGNDNWGSTSTTTQCYLKLPGHIDPEAIESRLPGFLEKYRNKEAAESVRLSLQPLGEMHYDTRFEIFGNQTVSKTTLFTLGLIGLFLLITACINFINLNTALAVNRSREVGVRKVLGSNTSQLMLHFLGETALVTFIAVVASVALAEVALGQLQSILGYHLEINLFSDGTITTFLLGVLLLVTIFAGSYPAFYLSRFSPVEAIRNKIASSYGEKLSMRRSLVVLQFAISQVLIICTIVIANQMRYFQTAEMGFDKEAIVETQMPNGNLTSLHRFKNQLLQNPPIKLVSFSNTGTASSNTWGGNYQFKDGEAMIEGHAHIKFIDHDFIETFGLRILAGEGLADSDTLQRFIVNESFVKDVGYGENHQAILGKTARIWGREAPIFGIVEDFNTTSLHHEIEPVIMLLENRYWHAAIKIDMNNADKALAAMKSTWAEIYPEFIFDYKFLDENIEEFYEDEKKTAQLINIFTTIAIIIGCLGLFGLVSYMATQRTKEIGIRKVLGASFANILSLFSREFALLILIAFVFAVPIGYYFMNSWLADFAYRIDLGIGVFLAALGASIMISLVTVAYKSIRASTANPVDALRYE